MILLDKASYETVRKKFLNGIDSVDLPDIFTATGKVNVSKDRKIIKVMADI